MVFALTSYNESCYCIVNEDHHRVADCTVCGESPAISNDYWTWFNDAQGMCILIIIIYNLSLVYRTC